MVIRGMFVFISAGTRDVTDDDFNLDKFYADLISKTNIVQTISSVIGMSRYRPETVTQD